MSHHKTLCVDFDGVLHDYTPGNWRDGELYGNEVPGAVAALFKLKSKGFVIVVHTTRGRSHSLREEAEKWLRSRAITQGLLRSEDPLPFEITNIKVPAIAYIDDRAIRFTNWVDVLKYFS